MDLSPRVSSDDAPLAPRVRRRRWPAVALLGVFAAAGALIVAQFLTSAIDYYCNVDEIGVRPGCDPDRRIRVQGNVVEGSVRRGNFGTEFALEFGGERLAVAYSGDPGGIFQECIPVVAHGRLVDGVLQSTRVEVRHSNEYEAENADRIEAAEASACPEPGE